jgi:NADPH:quinone reductase-like Zn-dependent oxidoreductase
MQQNRRRRTLTETVTVDAHTVVIPMLSSASLRTRCALALLGFLAVNVTLAAEPPALPSDMQAVRMHGKGGPEVLRLERVPVPQVGGDQVLIRVRAAGVNPVDWKLRERGARAGQAWIPGFDAAGVIAKAGTSVERWRAGDEVIAHISPVGGGGYAEYAVANARDIALKPRGMSFEEAAGIPTVGVTVWNYLVRNIDSVKGKRILIHGGAGGVGSAAVQIAKARGAHVIATASGRNHEYLRSIGVDQAIDYTTTRFEDAARDVDIVFDTVGGETLQRSYAIVRRGGTLISIVGRLSAQECAQRGINCPDEAASEGSGVALDAIRDLAEAGKFRLNVDRTFPLAEAAQAQELNRKGHTRGKIVLRMGT